MDLPVSLKPQALRDLAAIVLPCNMCGQLLSNINHFHSLQFLSSCGMDAAFICKGFHASTPLRHHGQSPAGVLPFLQFTVCCSGKCGLTYMYDKEGAKAAA